MEQRVENLTEQKIGVGPPQNLLGRAYKRKFVFLLRVVRENRLFQAILTLLEVVVQKSARSMRQKFRNFLVIFYISFILFFIANPVVLNVVTELSIREQEKIIVVLLWPRKLKLLEVFYVCLFAYVGIVENSPHLHFPAVR